MDQFINSEFELNTLELIDQGFKVYINRFQSYSVIHNYIPPVKSYAGAM